MLIFVLPCVSVVTLILAVARGESIWGITIDVAKREVIASLLPLSIICKLLLVLLNNGCSGIYDIVGISYSWLCY